VFGADDHGSTTHGQVMRVDPLLELPGGEHAGGPIPRDEARRPRPLSGPGRQQHHPRVQLGQPGGADERHRTGRVDPGHGRLEREPGAAVRRQSGQTPGVGGTTHGAAQVLEAEPGMMAVAGDPTWLGLAVDHQDRGDPEAAELCCGTEPRRSGPDDEHVRVGGAPCPVGAPAHRSTLVSSPTDRPVSAAVRATTSAPQ
jgi:hypothetical protein